MRPHPSRHVLTHRLTCGLNQNLTDSAPPPTSSWFRTVAGYITAATGLEAFDVGDVEGSYIEGADCLIVGAPTWHTGADEQRSGTSWDDFLYGTLTELDLSGKKVAIFGVGDSSSYADNFCDAAGELYDCFTKQGATVVGAVGTDDYDFIESKSTRDGKFVGMMFDEDNEDDKSEGRANAWIEQVRPFISP